MKKILVFLISFLMFGMFAYAVNMDVWLSSNTATADSAATLCGQYVIGGSSIPLHGVIHEVIVSSAIAATQIQLFDSSFTVTSATSTLNIGPIMTSSLSPGGYFYDTVFPHGLCYTKTGTAQVQILYQCY